MSYQYNHMDKLTMYKQGFAKEYINDVLDRSLTEAELGKS